MNAVFVIVKDLHGFKRLCAAAGLNVIETLA